MAGEVANIQDKYLYSLSQLATIYGIARETVSKRLQQNSVVPNEERRGHPVYHIAAASRAIIEGDNPQLGFDQIFDPDKLPPKDRKDWYLSEKTRKELERDDDITLYAAEHEIALGDVGKIATRILDTLEDHLEREGVTDEVLIKIETVVHRAKIELADHLGNYEYKRAAKPVDEH